MKNRLLQIAAILAITLCAHAEILVYKGNMTEKRVGNSAESRHSYRSLLIIDQATGTTKKIDYYPATSGFYMVEPERQFLTNKVVLKDGRSQTVLAWAQTGSPSEPVVSVFAKGINTRLQVASKGSTIAPLTLAWSLRSAGPNNGGDETLDETGVLTFHQAFTMAVNNHDEGLPEAEQRLRSVLETQGYREVEFK